MADHLARARYLIELKRYGLAADAARMAAADEPDCAEAHLLLATALLQMREFVAAIQEVNTAIGLAPQEAHAHFILSHISAKRRDYPHAIEAAREALRINPHFAGYYFHHAALLHDSGEFAASLEQVLQARRLDPRHAAAANLHVLLLYREDRIDEAEQVIGEILQVSPEFAWSHENKAIIAVKRGDYPQAIASYRESLRLDPHDKDARRGLIAAMKRRSPAYRALIWFFAANEGDAAAQAIGRGILVATIVLALPALGFALHANREQFLLLWPLLILGGVVCFMPIHLVLWILFHWFGDHFITLMLCLDPLGGKALSWEERRGAQFALACLAAAVAAGIAAAVWRSPWLAVVAVVALALTYPVPFILDHPAGPRRTVATTLMLFVGILVLLWAALRWFGNWELAEFSLIVGVWLSYYQYRRAIRTLDWRATLDPYAEEPR